MQLITLKPSLQYDDYLRDIWDMVQETKNFMNQKSLFPNNTWLHTQYISLYIRKAKRSFGNSVYRDCLDIANIIVKPEGQGIGTTLINLLHGSKIRPVTYVENAHHPHLEGWLNRNNWTKYSLVHCYFKEHKDSSDFSLDVGNTTT